MLTTTKKFFATALTSLLLCGASSAAYAQEDPNGEIMKKIYTKLVQSIDLRRPKTIEETDSQYFFVLTQPGIFIDPALLDSNGDEVSSQKRIFSEIIDRVMIPSWVYGPIDETYHEYYNLILNTYDFKPLPLTDEQQKRLDESRSLLWSDDTFSQESPIYQRYLARQDAYWNALDSVDAYINQNPGAAQIPQRIAGKLQNAENAWLTAGSKNQIENALEFIRRHDPEGFWAAAATRYKRTTQNASLHNYYPAIKTWLDKDNQWPGLSIKWSRNEGSTYSRHTKASGGGSFSAFGFFSIGGGTNYERIKKVEQNEAESIDIALEYLRVDFRRPWLSRSVFSNRRWRWECGTEPAIQKQLVSSGPVSAAADSFAYPEGLMPLVPTGFVIARNVKVTGSFSESFEEYYKRVITKSSSGGWGPFKVRGSYSDTVEKTDVESETSENGFTIGHPQIIGFFVETLPRSPDPLPDLFEPCE